jgi:hypothetical protein
VKTNLAAKVVITHQASGGSEKRSHRLGVTTEQAGEEGELIESQPDAEAESESYKDENLSTQQSSIMAGGTSNIEVDEDELLDYEDEDEPLQNELSEMATLEENVEKRASKLLEEQAIKLPTLDNSKEDNAAICSSKSSEESDEIDWDKEYKNMWGNSEKEFTLVKGKNHARGGLRRSSRNLDNTEKVQDKAEALKRKKNEISGTPSFNILNSVDPCILESVASFTNINLGKNKEVVATSISSIQALEIARAALLDAKQRVSEQNQANNIEGEHENLNDKSEHKDDKSQSKDTII